MTSPYNLVKGSRNHMRAFSKALSTQGYDTYKAERLEQSDVERCGP